MPRTATLWNKHATRVLRSYWRVHKTPGRVLEHSPWLKGRFTYQQVASKIQQLNKELAEGHVISSSSSSESSAANSDDELAMELDDENLQVPRTDAPRLQANPVAPPPPIRGPTKAAVAEARKHASAQLLVSNMKRSGLLPNSPAAAPLAAPAAPFAAVSEPLPQARKRKADHSAEHVLDELVENLATENSRLDADLRGSYATVRMWEDFSRPLFVRTPRKMLVILQIQPNDEAKITVEVEGQGVLRKMVLLWKRNVLPHDPFIAIGVSRKEWDGVNMEPKIVTFDVLPPGGGEFNILPRTLRRLDFPDPHYAIWQMEVEETVPVPGVDRFSE